MLRVVQARRRGRVETAPPRARVAFMRDYRALQGALSALGVRGEGERGEDAAVTLGQPFPETVARSRFGLKLGLKELRAR